MFCHSHNMMFIMGLVIWITYPCSAWNWKYHIYPNIYIYSPNFLGYNHKDSITKHGNTYKKRKYYDLWEGKFNNQEVFNVRAKKTSTGQASGQLTVQNPLDRVSVHFPYASDVFNAYFRYFEIFPESKRGGSRCLCPPPDTPLAYSSTTRSLLLPEKSKARVSR